MADTASRLEVRKLAAELDAPADDLDFLAESSVEEIRALRATIRESRHARHAELVERLAGLSRLLPVALTAKIAERAFGPVLSARVAGALDPKDAARLAGHLDRDFLARLSAEVDPQQIAPLVGALPADLMADTGRRLLAAGEHLALARFLSVVDTDLALRIVAEASPDDLLQVAVLTEDTDALRAIVERLDETSRAGVLEAAAGTDVEELAGSLLGPS